MKFILALLLAALLTGCAPQPPQKEAPPAPQAPVEAVLRLGGEEVPAWLYRYWLTGACRQLEQLYQKAGKQPDWNAPTPQGTLLEQARRQALADTALCAVVDRWARQWNCTLTEEDQDAIAALWAKRAESHGGEEAYLSALRSDGLTARQAWALAETGQRYRKLHTLAEEGGPLAPTDGELEQFSKEARAACFDLLETGEDRTWAESLFARLNTAADPAALFSALAAEGGTAGRLLTAGDGTLSPQAEEALFALPPGQHSGILHGPEGYFLLLRLPPSRSALTPLYLDAQLLEEASSSVFTVSQSQP